MSDSKKFSRDAGIAIGPILFVIAILGLLAAVVASGGGGFQIAGGADRITADITAQANLIRGTINQCNLQYQMAVSTGSVSPPAGNDYYPTSDSASGQTVRSITCTPMGGTSMWTDKLLPPPTAGFQEWMYIDSWSATPSSDHGRCIWTQPLSVNANNDLAITSGLTRAASKFNSWNQSTYNSAYEVIYNPSSASQKFIVWITLPQSGTADSNCLP